MYEPAEDSYLLEEEVVAFCKDKSLLKALEMGTGSGLIANTLAKYSKKVIAVDIDTKSLSYAKKSAKKNIEFVKSDLFKNIKEKEFDLIVFNPPYLPEDEHGKDKELAGGKEGVELTLKFLKQAKKHLSQEGQILFVASSLANLNLLDKKASKTYHLERIRELPLFFEKLYVYKATLEKKVVDQVKE